MFFIFQIEISIIIYENKGNTLGWVMKLLCPIASLQLPVTQGREVGLFPDTFPSSLHSLSPFQSIEPHPSCWKESPQDTARRSRGGAGLSISAHSVPCDLPFSLANGTVC